MIKILINEAKKAFLSPIFYLSFLFMGIGFYFAQADFSWVIDGVTVLQRTLGGGEWGIFGIVGCTMPYAASFCQEYLSGNMPFSMERIGLKKYCIGKAILCFFTGGLAAVFGRCLLLILSTRQVPILVQDPNWDTYQKVNYLYILLCQGKYLPYFCFQFLLCFCNGGLFASMGLSFSAFVLNPFMPWLAPYIILLILSIFPVPLFLNPITIERGRCIFSTFWANTFYSIAFYGIVSISFFFLFYFKVKRRVQHGQLS